MQVVEKVSSVMKCRLLLKGEVFPVFCTVLSKSNQSELIFDKCLLYGIMYHYHKDFFSLKRCELLVSEVVCMLLLALIGGFLSVILLEAEAMFTGKHHDYMTI